MTHANKCPICGSEMTDGAAGGLCPACLMEAGMTNGQDTAALGGSETNAIAAVEESVGRYSTLGEHGKGGMGRVLLVHDEHLGRDIALKELLPDLPDDGSTPTPVRHSKEMAARFLREAKITGKLEHPSITPVHELGRRADGTLYYTMKLVKGRTLSQAIKDAGSLEARLKLLPHFVDLCQAIAYAHSRGVIHRDIKPSNIMVGDYGETVVIDWGLAKIKGREDVNADAAQNTILSLKTDSGNELKTEVGHALGTPAYMPPEQARGELDRIDERSDIYSLGAVLYEILTAQTPFKGSSVQAVISQVIHDAPEAIKSLEGKAPEELVQNCERAMQKNPEERHGSAAELAEKIQNYEPRPFYFNPFRPKLAELVPELAALPKGEQRRVKLKAILRASRKWKMPALVAAGGVLVWLSVLFTTSIPVEYAVLHLQATEQQEYIQSLEQQFVSLLQSTGQEFPAPPTRALEETWVQKHFAFIVLFGESMSLLLLYVYLRFQQEWARQWVLPHIRQVLAERGLNKHA